MCYAKPGPRCSNHLAADIAKLETEIKELQNDTSDTAKFKLVQKRSRLDAYRFAFDGTAKGQKQLQAALDSMDLDDPDYRDIKKYKDNTLKEYDLKLRNFREAEQIRKEREAVRAAIVSRKAELEAELAALDAAAEAEIESLEENREKKDPLNSIFDEGRESAVKRARAAATARRIAGIRAKTEPEKDKEANEAISKETRIPRRPSTTSAAYEGKSTGRVSTAHYAYSGKGYGGK